MATSATTGFGVLLQIDIASTFTTIAEVTSLSGPSISRDAIDVTSMDSTNGWREFIGGVIDGGEVTAEVNFLPAAATHQAVTDLLADYTQAPGSFKIVWTDSGTTEWAFSGIVTDFSPGAEIDGQLTASITIKVSASMTLPT